MFAVTFLGRLPAPDKLKGTAAAAARRMDSFSFCPSPSPVSISPAWRQETTAEDKSKRASEMFPYCKWKLE